MINKLKANCILPVIGGPTATGKTEVALRLSELIDIEIISADSRQVYKYLDIGTAKPSSAELAKVKHHFIDELEPDDYFSAGEFGDRAYETVKDIYHRGKLPVVVGGSGLYIKALCEGIFKHDNKEMELRAESREVLQKRLDEFGKDILYEELKEIDPEAAKQYRDKNPRRIIRAMEHYYATGKQFSKSMSNVAERKLECYYYGIDMPRNVLYNRINARCVAMWDGGIVEELQGVLDKDYAIDINALNTVGYKEAAEYLAGDIDADRALYLMQRNTRHFAKRQFTWFRKYENMLWLNGHSGSIAKQIYWHLSELIKDQ